ncbi:hypothetical protein LRP50_18425 [Enterovibrio sp. ZSDZ42]|uniref:Uncharacterized protein n=1 Tax=Enterovibrio gelatinilyticus TaxID=2899819 RepID=A0ABT5R4C5_9GAMM|nr:hypothetical protein [Enterovibrio sp. ZSDZ42]MDD1795108.1 hypothetical protein [Enterovibrio sp. ZSDZ42]
MKIKAWLGVLVTVFLSWMTVAEEKDIYRQYVDRSVDRGIPKAVERWAQKILKEEDEERFLPVIEEFIASIFSDAFRERTATTYRRTFSEEEMQIVAENMMSEICAPIFNPDFIERIRSDEKMSKADIASSDRCFAALQDIENATEKIENLAVINNDLYIASFNLHFDEFLEKIKQQRLIFYIVDKSRKTLPVEIDEELTWSDIVGEYLVLEYIYTFNDLFGEDEPYEFDRESVLIEVCRGFYNHFREYVSVRYSVFDLDRKLVGETTISLSECP